MGVIVRFKIVTTDDDPIVVQYGNTVVEIASDTYTTFALPNGDPTMFSVLDPERVLKIIDDGSSDRRGGTVDISSFPNVIEVLMRDSGITELLLGTVYPTSIDLSGNNLTAEAIDNILTTLDGSAVENGVLNYDDQEGGTEAWASRIEGAQTAQESLEGKGWTITPAVPE